jgi:hypothetical protein
MVAPALNLSTQPILILFMKKYLKVIYLSIAVAGLIVISIIFGINIEKIWNRASIIDQSQSPNDLIVSEMKIYKSEALNFSIKYPSVYKSIQEDSNSVTFRVNPEDMWGFSVTTEKVSYDSTKDWFEAQPKGNAEKAGFEAVLWSSDNLVFVEEYVVVDQDGSRPIYGKILYAAFVSDGRLYKIQGQHDTILNAVPSMDAEMLSVVSSFQLLK